MEKPMKIIAKSLYGWKNALATLGVVALFSSTTAAAPIPPGFSSEIIQVKFKEGTDVHPPSRPLPPDLLNSVGRITRLFTLSEQEIDRLRAKGEQVSRNPLLLNPGDSAPDTFHDDHGTAVLGEVIADNDAKGVTGISWGAGVGLAPTLTMRLGYNPANAIMLAVADGSAGDVILIENQTPVCGGECGKDQVGCGPLEAISPVFAAIQTAVANRITVVETAGNGGVNLDQAACHRLFDRTFRDSGAILVGAGGAPGSRDRQRLSYSCYGDRLDVQGWGEAIVTTGIGDLYKNPDDQANRNFWYTREFGGTSGAGPIVAGAAINLQGIALNRFGVPLNPVQIRGVLVQTGSPQQG